MTTRNLIDILRELPATGPNGFEGLVAQLLDALTGAHFTLAQTGSQEGRDISARQPGTNVTAVECKRYRDNTALDQRELLGEFVQVSESIPDLDVWVLVASRDVNSQLAEALHKTTARLGVAFVAISAGDGTPSSLEVLCAQASDVLISHPGFLSVATPDEIRPQLDGILAHPNFPQKVAALRLKFTDPAVGLDSWRRSQNQRFLQILSTERDSRAQFGQPINVEDKGISLVPRIPVWARMGEWLEQWKTNHLPLVITGEEGDGKTWAVASWLSQLTSRNNSAPAVVFLASTSVETQDVELLFMRAIARQLPLLSEEQAKRLLNRWMQRTEEQEPLFFAVFDGINERRSPEWWRMLFQHLAGAPWWGRVGVIITCRTFYWQRYFSPLRSFKVVHLPLPPYDDAELNSALAQYHLHREHIQDVLLPIIRKPRYFDLMVRYRDRVAESGDVTIARLVYEDWRDRLERKADTPLTNEEFQQVIRHLVEAQEQRAVLGEQDIVATLPVFSEKERIYEELRTGGILTERKGKYHVDERLLVFGLGLLLVEQVEQAAKDGDDLREIISRWLEPRSEMDIKAVICEYAALHALQLADIAREVKASLLQAWVDTKNPSENTEQTITAYIPIDPDTYIQLAEMVWLESNDNRWAQQILIHAFIEWYSKSSQVASALVLAFERWLGFVPLNGYDQREESEEELEKLHREMAERVGERLSPGALLVAQFPLTVVEDGSITRLGRTALAVISHASRLPFIHAIAIGCVAEAVAGRPYKYDLFSWVLGTASEDIWPELEKEVQHLLADGSVVAQQAAYRLLSFDGREAAYSLRTTISDTIFPRNTELEELLKDPCASGFAWNFETCNECLKRQDLNVGYVARYTAPHCNNPDLVVPDYYREKFNDPKFALDTDTLWIALGGTEADHILEMYEPILLRFAPYYLVDLIRSVVRQIRHREGLARRQLSFQLSQYSLIFTEDEWQAVRDAWQQLVATAATWEEAEETAEFVLYRMLFFQGSAEDHIAAMLRRPIHLPEETRNRENFLPVANWEFVRQALKEISTAEGITRLLWYISPYSNDIPSDIMREHVVPYLGHERSDVRTIVLEIIGSSGLAVENVCSLTSF
jgi:hypothetical protein